MWLGLYIGFIVVVVLLLIFLPAGDGEWPKHSDVYGVVTNKYSHLNPGRWMWSRAYREFFIVVDWKYYLEGGELKQFQKWTQQHIPTDEWGYDDCRIGDQWKRR